MNKARAYLRPALGAGLTLLGLLAASLPANYVLQLVGTAATLGGLALLWQWAWPLLDGPLQWPWRWGKGHQPSAEPGTRWTGQRLVCELAGPAVLVGLLLLLYRPLLGGQMPWQADHTVHQFKAWLLAERLLPSGRLMGWTHQSGSGYPAEVLYPPLGDLWMATVRYATFKQLSWDATYALGFFGVLSFCTLAFYAMGRRLFGALAGFATAFFVLTDMGAFREGGFVFTVRYGVWPLQLGVTLGLVAVVQFHLLLATRGWRHLLRTSVAIGAALLAHPVSLLLLLVAVPVDSLFTWLRRRPDDDPRLGRALAAVGLGLGLAACWLLPFVTQASDFAAHVSNYWKPISDIAGGLVEARLWSASWAWPAVAGGLGGLLALRERRPVATYLFALSGLLLLAGSLTTYTELGLPNWIKSARFVQFQRFVILVKLLWFLLAGFLLQRLFMGLAHDSPDRRADDQSPTPATDPEQPPQPAWKGWAVGAVVCLLASPFVLPLGWKLVEQRIMPVGHITTAKAKGNFPKQFRAALGRVCAEAKKPGAPFFRVAYLSAFNDHEMANAATYCAVPEVKLSFIPSETFKYRANLSPGAVPRTKEDLRALNVRYVVTNASRKAPSWLTPVARFGRVAIHEVPDYQPERFSVLKRVQDAEGRERYERVDPKGLGLKAKFEDEEIRISATSAPANHFLVLHVAHFVAWRAERSGKRLAIRAYDGLAPRVKGLMMVPLGTGTTVFTYRRRAANWLGWLATLLSIALLVLIAVARRRAGLATWLRTRLEPWVQRLRRPARLTALGLAIAALLLVLLRAGGCLGKEPRVRSLAHELGRAEVAINLRQGGRLRCTTYQFGRWICGGGRRFVGPVAEEWNLLNRFGLWAHPDERGVLSITWPAARLGSALEIDYGVLQSGGPGDPVVLRVFIDDKPAGEVRWPRRAKGPAGWSSRPLRIDTKAWRQKRAKLRFEVSSRSIGGRHFAFDPRIVR